MQLETTARDCLFLNWALPLDAAPAIPATLRYETHRWQGGDWVFVSALLFRFAGLHPQGVPLLSLSYPQAHLRLYVLDPGGEPSVIFLRMMVPFWVAPVSRLLGRQPASVGWFSYPRPSEDAGEGAWSWSLRRPRALDIAARLAAPSTGRGPCLGSWQQTVDYVRRRSKGYVIWEGRLRSLNRRYSLRDAVWPLAAEVEDAELLEDLFPAVDFDHWRQPHSAWLCPEIPIAFEVGKPIRWPRLAPVSRRVVAGGT